MGDYSYSYNYQHRSTIQELTNNLKGDKILIIGNHDYIKSYNKNIHNKKATREYWHNIGFDEVMLDDVILNDRFILSHEPRNVDDSKYNNIHGHLHNKQIKDNKHYNVSANLIHYTPIEFGYVASILDSYDNSIKQTKKRYKNKKR